MIVISNESVNVIIKPKELSEDIITIIGNKIEKWVNQHIKGKNGIISKVISIDCIENVKIDVYTGNSVFVCKIKCEKYMLHIDEKINLPVKTANKHGLYFDYGPYEIFITDPNILSPSNSTCEQEYQKKFVPGSFINMKVSNITYSSITNKYVVIAILD